MKTIRHSETISLCYCHTKSVRWTTGHRTETSERIRKQLIIYL